MADNLEDVDIEVLITEVRNHPVIWNNANPDYNDYVKKREAWMAISRTFTNDFSKKSNSEKNEICNKLIKKWRNVKDNYVRSIRKKRTSGKHPDSKPYLYARLLSFLQKEETEDYLPTNVHSVLEMDCTQDDSMNSSSEHGGFDNWSPSYEIEMRSKKRKYSNDLCPAESPQVAASSTSIIIPDFNADRSFFESILPSIYEFTEDQKLDFRSEVLNAIKRIRKGTR